MNKRKPEIFLVLVLLALSAYFSGVFRGEPPPPSPRDTWQGATEPRIYDLGIGSSPKAVWEKIGPLQRQGQLWSAGSVKVQFGMVEVEGSQQLVPSVVAITGPQVENPRPSIFLGPFANLGDPRESIHRAFNEVPREDLGQGGELYTLSHPGGAESSLLEVLYEGDEVVSLTLYHPNHLKYRPAKAASYPLASGLPPYGAGATPQHWSAELEESFLESCR